MNDEELVLYFESDLVEGVMHSAGVTDVGGRPMWWTSKGLSGGMPLATARIHLLATMATAEPTGNLLADPARLVRQWLQKKPTVAASPEELDRVVLGGWMAAFEVVKRRLVVYMRSVARDRIRSDYRRLSPSRRVAAATRLGGGRIVDDPAEIVAARDGLTRRLAAITGIAGERLAALAAHPSFEFLVDDSGIDYRRWATILAAGGQPVPEATLRSYVHRAAARHQHAA